VIGPDGASEAKMPSPPSGPPPPPTALVSPKSVKLVAPPPTSRTPPSSAFLSAASSPALSSLGGGAVPPLPSSSPEQAAALVEKHLQSMSVTADMSEEEANEARSQYITLELECQSLDKSALGVLAWSHPFLSIFRSRSTIFEKVAETNICRNTANPLFSPIILNLYRMSHNAFDKPIKIQAMSWDPDGGPPAVFGELTTNLNQLLAAAQTSDTMPTGAGTGSSSSSGMASPPASGRPPLHRVGSIVGRRAAVFTPASPEKRLVFRRKDRNGEWVSKEAGFLVVRKSNIYIHTTQAVLSSTQAHARLFNYQTECLTNLVFRASKLEKQSSIGSGKADPFVMIYGLSKNRDKDKDNASPGLTSSKNGVLPSVLTGAGGAAAAMAAAASATGGANAPGSPPSVVSSLSNSSAAAAAGALATLASTSLSSKWTLIYESEVVAHTLNPSFLPALIPVHDLCAGEYDRDILVRVLTKRSIRAGPLLPDGSPGVPIVEGELIGEFETTLKSLLKGCNPSGHRTRSKKLHLINPRKKVADKSYKNSGDIVMLEAKVFTLSSRASELEASLLSNVEKPDPTSRRSSLLAANGIASLSRARSRSFFDKMLGAGAAPAVTNDDAADLQKSSLMSKVRAVARLAGEAVDDERSQAQMVTELQRQRTGQGMAGLLGLSEGTKSRRSSGDGAKSRRGSGERHGEDGTSVAGSATDNLIARMMRKSSRRELGAAAAAGGSASVSPDRSRRATGDKLLPQDSLILGSPVAPLGAPGNSPDELGGELLVSAGASSGRSRSSRRSSLGGSLARSNLVVSLSFRAADLRRMDTFLGWADSYLQLLRLKDDVWSELAATSVVSGEKNPVWDTLQVRLSKLRAPPEAGASASAAAAAASSSSVSDPLNLGGVDYPLVLKVWHWKKRGDPELIGLCETSLTSLQSRAQALQEADPRAAPAVAGADTKPLPASALADGTPLARAHALPLMDPALSTGSGKAKNGGAAPKPAGLLYVTNSTLLMKDSNKRKSQRSQRRKTLLGAETSTMAPSAEPSRTKTVWPW